MDRILKYVIFIWNDDVIFLGCVATLLKIYEYQIERTHFLCSRRPVPSVNIQNETFMRRRLQEVWMETWVSHESLGYQTKVTYTQKDTHSKENYRCYLCICTPDWHFQWLTADKNWMWAHIISSTDSVPHSF